jgi:hypothetical protein
LCIYSPLRWHSSGTSHPTTSTTIRPMTSSFFPLI